METIERFTKKYTVSDSGCWVWQASKNPFGYGFFNDKKTHIAHRWAYQYFKGEIPKGLVIDHLCKNTSCVNPDHLEAVTQQINFLRGTAMSKIISKTHCKNGHEYTLENTIRYKSRRGRLCRTCNNSYKKK